MDLPKIHNHPAEFAILGPILSTGTPAYYRVADMLAPEHFHDARNAAIYEAVNILVDNSQPVDLLTVQRQLQADGKLEGVGGMERLMDISEGVISPGQIVNHAKLVREAHMRRTAMMAAQDILARASDMTVDPFDLCEDGATALSEAVMVRQSKAKPFQALFDKAIENLQTLQSMDGNLTGISTGFQTLDSWTKGLQPSKLYILAARPAMGKSSLAATIAKNVSKSGIPTRVVSLEMDGLEIALRLIGGESGVFADRMATGNLTPADWHMINTKGGNIAGMPMQVEVEGAMKIGELKRRCRVQKQRDGLGLLMVDYLQLMTGNKGGNREVEIASISRGLKEIAMDLEIPVLALSQLSRAVENRGGDKRPQLSDLRESGAIEQDADCVMFLYRPEYYGLTSFASGESTKNIAEIIIAKQRGGKTGDIQMRFYPSTQTWLDLDEEDPEPITPKPQSNGHEKDTPPF